MPRICPERVAGARERGPTCPGRRFSPFLEELGLAGAAPQPLPGAAQARQGSSVPHSLLILTSSLERLGSGGPQKYGLDLLVFPF